MVFARLPQKETCLKIHPHKWSHMTFCLPLKVLRKSNLCRVPQETFVIGMVTSLYQ